MILKKAIKYLLAFLLLPCLADAQQINILYPGGKKDSMLRTGNDVYGQYTSMVKERAVYVENDFDASVWWIKLRKTDSFSKLYLGRLVHPGLYKMKLTDTFVAFTKANRETLHHFLVYNPFDRSGASSALSYPVPNNAIQDPMVAVLDTIRSAIAFMKNDSLQRRLEQLIPQMELQVGKSRIAQFMLTFTYNNPVGLVIRDEVADTTGGNTLVAPDDALKYMDVFFTELFKIFTNYNKDTITAPDGTQTIIRLVDSSDDELRLLRSWYNTASPCSGNTHPFFKCVKADGLIDDLCKYYANKFEANKSVVWTGFSKESFLQFNLVFRIYGRENQ